VTPLELGRRNHMVVPPCRRLWDPRMSRLTPGPRRSPGRRSGDPHSSKNSWGSTLGHFTYRDPHLGQSSPGTPGCRAGTPRWYSTPGSLFRGVFSGARGGVSPTIERFSTFALPQSLRIKRDWNTWTRDTLVHTEINRVGASRTFGVQLSSYVIECSWRSRSS